MQDDKDDPKSMKVKDSFNVLVLLLGVHRMCFIPFLRYDFGPRAFGKQAAMALGMILLYGSFEQTPAMFDFMWVWLVVVVLQRFRTTIKLQKGWVVHSQYPGYPILMRFVRREETAKMLEAVLCALVGIFLCPISVGLGGFVLLGLLSLSLYEGIEQSVIQARVRRMRDAQIVQRGYSEVYRNGKF